MDSKIVPTLMLAATLCMASGAAMADNDWGWSKRGPDVAAVKNDLYRDECGACHFAYQPGLLPVRSWQRLMETLDNHFGENAELDTGTRYDLTSYLAVNAAEFSATRRSAKILRSLGGDAPLRITDVPYIRYKHNEIPLRFIRDNAEVRSLSNCASCHTRADTGSFAEREINVPGLGRWDD
jgi:hypothetical protein